MKRLRTVFMGTPDFAVPCLVKLMEISEIIGVVTQPDKKRGRGQKMAPSPVKAFAQAHGLSIYQPQRIREEAFIAELEMLAPELIVVVAFGQILPQRVLDIPPLGCINVHASLLPRYRGAAPMQRCLMAGESMTGVTTMFMDAGLDTGDMLLWKAVAIDADMTMETLHDILSDIGAELLVKTIKALTDGTLVRTKQDDRESCYAAMLTKETGRMNWERSAVE
ncbi:MAG: methionyl-tRNA formyltransferase, partial [Schwartzia sp.]|nr:methionyl-tRNA formyltransferase [Schwartzia sp. (in: firmicutes)]